MKPLPNKMYGRHMNKCTSDGQILNPAQVYDEEYYNSHCGDRPYQKGDPGWTAFYAMVADNIIRAFRPRSVFDAGCGIGFLVEALWDRSVEAFGRDISEYAINQVRRDVQAYCSLGSITDPIEGEYDLILCIEVLEHLEEMSARIAASHLVAAGPRILFSSTPIDMDEPTHVNVRPPIYWLQLFADLGCRPVMSFDATFLAPHALVFERTNITPTREELLNAAELIRLRILHQSKEQELNRLASEAEELTAQLVSIQSQRDQLLINASELREEMDAEVGMLRSELRDRDRKIQLLSETLLQDNENNATAASPEPPADANAQSVLSPVEDLQIRERRFWSIIDRTAWLKPYIPSALRRRLLFEAKRLWLARLPELKNQQLTVRSRSTEHGSTRFRRDAWLPDLEPLHIFHVEESTRTVNMITDSISPGSLYGGVGTSIILSALLARQLGARLRILTRTQAGNGSAVAKLLRLHNIEVPPNLELRHIGLGTGAEVPVATHDVFLTTSWWTTASTLQTIGRERVAYVLQEDERMFYPQGDHRLLCSEVLSTPGLHTLINTELLFRYLVQGPEEIPGLRERAIAFEPSFPDSLFFPTAPEHAVRGDRLTFLFYARPNNVRNLYRRGMEALEHALQAGTLDSERWRFVFIGKDLPEIRLPGDPSICTYENVPWEEYAKIVRTAHVGMSLIHTPHPSYVPLDLAASGAVVVTNTYGDYKENLFQYSKNIITATPTVEGLSHAIGEAVALCNDTERLTKQYQEANIQRDWSLSSAAALAKCGEWFGRR